MKQAAEDATRGERLDRRLERGAVEVDEVVAIARVLAAHLDAEHAAGRTDGALLPARLTVSTEGAPVLLAHDGEPPIKAYIAPEAWMEAATPRSDQFSMAAILYEALCGGRAFPGDDSAKVHVSITTGSRVPLAARVPGMADAVDSVFERALSVSPDARFDSCGAFAEALIAAVETSRQAASTASVLVQKPSSRPSSRRPPPMRAGAMFDDEAPQPIAWAQVLGALLLLAVLAAALAVLIGK